MSPTLIIILALAIVYGYLNGQHGSAAIVSTMISSRALGPRPALLLAAIGITAGPFLLGVAVADTIASELIAVEARSANAIIAGLIGATVWNAVTLWMRLPSSISQALIGGLMGAAIAAAGLHAVLLPGLIKTLIALFLSPILGLIVGFWLVRLFYNLSASATPHINVWFRRGQVLVALFMAIVFGANDGQKIMGAVVLGLFATGFVQTMEVPTWVIILSAVSIGIGTLAGGWKLIHTLGGKFYKIRPIHGFGAQVASGLIIFVAGLLGGPVSGSQVITSAIVGAGSADRIQKVRWGVVQNILVAWLLTMPASAAVSAIAYLLTERLLP